MASITTWTRLEPRSRTTDIELGLAARVHDPLWFVARQWQLGEFQADDSGTPVMTALRASVGRVDRFQAGLPGEDPATTVVPVDGTAMPLEAIVEREVLDARSARRLAVDTGAHFVRMLTAAGLGSHRDAFVSVFPPDPESSAADPIAARVPDGLAMRRRLAPGDPLPAELNLGGAEAAVTDVVEDWLVWIADLVTEPPEEDDAWEPSRLEYRFSVAATVDGVEHTLVAEEYASGHLDWYAFEAQDGSSLGSAPDEQTIARDVLPTPVGYAGMPAPRWWEFEDARVDFGAVDGSGDDLSRMLLVEFAVVFGNDWYVIPVDLPVGALCRINSLVVTDTFGVRTVIHAASEADPVPWRMYSVTGAPPDVFFLPPSLGSSVEGPARERVEFVRDEVANLAWAIEEAVEALTGEARLRDDEALGRTEPPDGTSPIGEQGDRLLYRVRTDVPAHWFPLVTVALPGRPAVELELRTLLGPDAADEIPKGVVLSSDDPLRLFEAEVPREGAYVERSYQLTRWMGGGTVAWSGRRTRVGRGPAASGLRFDTSDPVPR